METLFAIDNVIATLIEFKSAEENKKIAETEKLRRAQILEEQRKREQEEYKQRAMELIPHIIDTINCLAKQGETSLHIEWREKQKAPYKISDTDWLHSYQYIEPILEKMGYTFKSHWYSESWRTRSGKIGYLYIYWN